MFMKRLLSSTIVGLWCLQAVAAPTPAPVRAEVDALLEKLKASGCQFNRNGSWYSASEAKDHLLRKLEYFEGKTTLLSAEQFIDLAATKSSSSGQTYQVKCGTSAAAESKVWLSAALATIRSAKAKP